MKGYRMAILRHGRTAANEEGRYIGRTDLPLSEDGREELEHKKDICDYPNVQKVYSSPLKRCIESAEALFPERELAVVDGLREMDFGDFENMTVEDLIDLDSYKQWLKGGMDNAPPGGESLRAMVERCFTSIHAILKDMMKNNLTHCAIVTHSGILMNTLSCFGLPRMKALDFTCQPGEGFEFVVTPQYWQSSGVFEIMGRVPYRWDETSELNSFGIYDDEEEDENWSGDQT